MICDLRSAGLPARQDGESDGVGGAGAVRHQPRGLPQREHPARTARPNQDMRFGIGLHVAAWCGGGQCWMR